MSYHNFDDELVPELPSCAYANHNLASVAESAEQGVESVGSVVGSRGPPNLCGINVNALRHQLHNPYVLQPHPGDYMDPPSTSTSSPVNLSTGTSISTYGGCNSPYKIQRQQTSVRERKRIMRSAPNGFVASPTKLSPTVNFTDFSSFYLEALILRLTSSAFMCRHFRTRNASAKLIRCVWPSPTLRCLERCSNATTIHSLTSRNAFAAR